MTTGRIDESTTCADVTRRDFLRVSGLGLGSWGLCQNALGAGPGNATDSERAVILLLLVGGPSQLETWDPKPDAPPEIRGPFGSIATRCPGARISEHLPRLAARLDRLALVRSVHHDAAPIHETGCQLLQTGRLCRLDEQHPHVGSVIAQLRGAQNGLPAFVVLPGPIASTGVGISHGQSAGWLGAEHEPFQLYADPAADLSMPVIKSTSFVAPWDVLDRVRDLHDHAVRVHAASAPTWARAAETLSNRAMQNALDLRGERASMRDAYGRSTFGQSCLMARRLVEAGVRLVTVNMFETVFNRVTWDCHGAAPFSKLDDYARELLPTFDQAFSALLDDLSERGRLERTLVVAAGEFGRTPRINAAGGRDHWPGVWSVALAGGGIQGGRVIGASDAHAAAPAERSVTPQDLLATIYYSQGIEPGQPIARADGRSYALDVDGEPIRELFG
jgi:uncharacterized protein (DUF1501 family)